MEEIKYIKNIIEKDCRTEYGGMVERLKQAEGSKLSLLQHEMSNIQNEIEMINGMLTDFMNDTKKDVNPLHFMVKASVVRSNMEKLMSKPFNKDIDVNPYDFPREMAQLREDIDSCKTLEGLLNMKNEVVFQMFQHKKEAMQRSTKDLNTAANEEINQWANLLEKYSGELQKYQLICFYCSEPMDTKN